MKKIYATLTGLLFICSFSNAQLINTPVPKQDSTIKVIPYGRHELYTIDGKLVPPDEVKR